MLLKRLWAKYKNGIFRFIEFCCYVAIGGAMWWGIEIFLWGREIHYNDPKYVADAETLGNFGDFMAGTVGCVIAVVSMYLLFRTLKSQRAATISNNKLMTIQRFNDLFFRLIDLYRQLSNDLVVSINQSPCIDGITAINSKRECSDKDYFNIWRSVIENSNQSSRTFDDINRQTIKYYLEFYNQDKNKLGAYFRTLYRILELIDVSDISDEDKRNYSKILRAQLCESELFMLFYNSQTELGQKLGKFLWKYHILKHLPVDEIVEFQKLYKDLTNTEKIEIDKIYTDLLASTKKIVNDYKDKPISHVVETEHFSLKFDCVSTPVTAKTCQVNLTVKAKGSIIYKEEPHLCRFSPNDWNELFNNLLSVINVFSKHTVFTYQSKFVAPNKPNRILIFTLVSYN